MADRSLWETATKLRDGWAEAAARKAKKVFSANGQPQWRKKVRMVGFSSDEGRWSFDVGGALAPMAGTGAMESWEGNIHDAASCRKLIVERGVIPLEYFQLM